MEAGDRGRGPRKWAELRFSVVGPLLSSPPPEGELCQALSLLAKLRWKHPMTGEMVGFSTSTIERWYYAARGADDPVAALMRKLLTEYAATGLPPAYIPKDEVQKNSNDSTEDDDERP